jgi:BirA family biotin operon repressor/biotin-[acetyl-CoA-carboxylase] ligase
MSDPLPEELASALRVTSARRRQFGETVVFFNETSSTNDVAATLAEHGAAEGTTVVAHAQTAGRGRLRRSWFSPSGAGLYASVIFRDSTAAPYLTLAGGVAVADGIRRATGLPVHIKWPNDIVVADAAAPEKRRKLAGILAEASSGSEGLQHVVLGFGINLRSAAYPPEIADRASSIETELGREVDGWAVLAETLAALSGVASELASGRTQPVLDRWRALAPSALGTPVSWDAPAGSISGVSAGIADDGALLVRVSNRVERIISGELRWG